MEELEQIITRQLSENSDWHDGLDLETFHGDAKNILKAFKEAGYVIFSKKGVGAIDMHRRAQKAEGRIDTALFWLTAAREDRSNVLKDAFIKEAVIALKGEDSEA